MSAYQVDRRRWQGLSIYEQMGNIGSEVGRSIAAQRSGDKIAFERALARALDLFDATVDVLSASKSVRVREVLRARDQFLQLFAKPDPINDSGIENYFLEFALAARRQR